MVRSALQATGLRCRYTVMTRTQPDSSQPRPVMLLVGWAASVVPLGGVEGIEARAGDADVVDPAVAPPVATTPLT
jgi:hypothetical protein